MLGEPTQISEKLRVSHKNYILLPWQKQIIRFFQDFSEKQHFYLLHAIIIHFRFVYSTGHSQYSTDFAKTNQNEVVRIRTKFSEDFRIRKLIRENEFVTLNLWKKIGDSEFIKIIRENEFVKGNQI